LISCSMPSSASTIFCWPEAGKRRGFCRIAARVEPPGGVVLTLVWRDAAGPAVGGEIVWEE